MQAQQQEQQQHQQPQQPAPGQPALPAQLSGGHGPSGLSHSSGLTDELARRLNLEDQAQPNEAPTEDPDAPLYFCEPRHDADSGAADAPAQTASIVSKWRQKERLKTTAVALVMCLNIGVDPPDVIKISPCARLECWVDPLSVQAPKALETIGKNLQAQYERWQPRAKYKMHLDPTMDDVKKLALSCRRTAKGERVLFHYNGHGVPRPTANGEVWVFNKNFTQYIPMSLYDLQAWVGSPAIYVFDCSAAGLIINSFRSFATQRAQEMEQVPRQTTPGTAGYLLPPVSGSQPQAPGRDPMADTIILAACGTGELLPQSPDLPADVFTACLTTPIKVALRWFCSRSLLRHEGLTKELIDRIPGKQTDRKTPLGELNWIFTAITDTIAWNMLPRPLFQKLFRQDLLVASLFRNFLLAERIMREANCTPQSYPRLPAMHQHPMWQAWDMTAEMCLLQLPALLNGENTEFQPSSFFSEQLTAFELWLEHGSKYKRPPEQLPIVLQVLLSQVHRLRALVLLGRFLDMGSWAVDLALSVGIFPYVLKLLQTTAPDLRQTLVFIWTKILALDRSCQVDLVKDNGHLYFSRYLESASDPYVSPDSRAQAAFILAVICDGHPRGQALCAAAGLLRICRSQLPGAQKIVQSGGSPLLMKWLLLAIGKLCEDNAENSAAALLDGTPDELAGLLDHPHPDVRAAAVFALGALVQAHEPGAGPYTRGVGDLGSHDSVASLHREQSHGLMSVASSASIGAGLGPGGVGAVPPPGGMQAGGGAGLSATIPEKERMAMERAIACHLLQVVYDASPLVRAEVAVALARVASGHSVLWQDAAHAAMKHSAAVLRSGASGVESATRGGGGMLGSQTSRSAPTAASAEGPAALRHAMTAMAAQRGAASAQAAGPAASRRGEGANGNMMATPEQQGGSGGLSSTSPCPPVGMARQGSRSQPVSPATSPGVRQLAGGSGGFEPVLHIGIQPEGGPVTQAGVQAGGGVYASADAARVGGGLYSHLLEAVCTLATDPAPKVAAQGLASLRASSVELVEVKLPPQAPGGGGSGGGGAVGDGVASLISGRSLPPMGISGGAGLLGSLASVGRGGMAGSSFGSSAAAAIGGGAVAAGGGGPGGGRGGLAGSSPGAALTLASSLSSAGSSLAKLNTRIWRGAPPVKQASVGASGGPGSAVGSPGGAVVCARTAYVLRRSRGSPGLGGMFTGLGSVGSDLSDLGRSHDPGQVSAFVAAANASNSAIGGQYPGGAHYPHPDQAAAAAALHGGGPSSASLAGSVAGGGGDVGLAAAGAGPSLPRSSVYISACDSFSWPLLGPGGAWRAGAYAGSASSPYGAWGAVPDQQAPLHWSQEDDPAAMEHRKRERAEAISQLHATGTACTMRKDVISCDMECSSMAALEFEPFGNSLVGVDGKGTVRVFDYRAMCTSNRFHVSTGQVAAEPRPPQVSVVALHTLNQLQSPLLLAGAADGAVRIWRHFTHKGSQRLASAFQAVPVAHAGPLACVRPTCFQYGRASGHLLAAGGSQPLAVHVWDLHSELRLQEVHIPTSGTSSLRTTSLPSAGPSTGGTGAMVGAAAATGSATTASAAAAAAAAAAADAAASTWIEHLQMSADSHLLFAGCSNGAVHMFDLRRPQQAVQSIRPLQHGLAGMVAEPGGTCHLLVTASSKGQLQFCDFRNAGAASSSAAAAASGGGAAAGAGFGVWKSVEAHSRGNLTALEGHANAPLLATGTTSQVVKLWSPEGEQLGVCRTNTSLLQRIGPVTCLRFHPFRPLLAGGGGDSVVALYNIHPSPGAQS